MKTLNPIYENITTSKLNQLLNVSKETHSALLDEIETSSYSFDELKQLKANKKKAADNIKSLTKELKARTV